MMPASSCSLIRPRFGFSRLRLPDFLAAAVDHIPPKSRHTIRYYGVYSNKSRGMERRSPPDSPPPVVAAPHASSARALRPLWRDLIMRVWGSDPLECPECKATMRAVDTFFRPEEIEFFLRLLGLWEGVIALPPPPAPPFDVATMEPIEPPPGFYWPEDDDPDAFQLESLDPSPVGMAAGARRDRRPARLAGTGTQARRRTHPGPRRRRRPLRDQDRLNRPAACLPKPHPAAELTPRAGLPTLATCLKQADPLRNQPATPIVPCNGLSAFQLFRISASSIPLSPPRPPLTPASGPSRRLDQKEIPVSKTSCCAAAFVAVMLTSRFAGQAADIPADFSAHLPASTKSGERSLKDSLLPAVKRCGFRMDDYLLWCPSVIKVGGTYHMFASRWPARYGIGGWTRFSECVLATSTNLLGPYTFQEVVLQKRPDNWDNTRIHNVKIVKAGSKFVLYHIDTANETGYAVADSITGPWTRQDRIAMRVSNPAPLVRPDGSIYVLGRLRDDKQVNRGIAFSAPGFEGPYTVLENGDNLLPENYELEDPTIWWANDQYNVLLNDWKGKATGITKAGAQYWSKDGLHYHLMSPEPVFTKTVVYDDGTSETFRRRERPFLYTNERDEVTALFTACLLPPDGPARIVVQPVDHYVPEN